MFRHQYYGMILSSAAVWHFSQSYNCDVHWCCVVTPGGDERRVKYKEDKVCC